MHEEVSGSAVFFVATTASVLAVRYGRRFFAAPAAGLLAAIAGFGFCLTRVAESESEPEVIESRAECRDRVDSESESESEMSSLTGSCFFETGGCFGLASETAVSVPGCSPFFPEFRAKFSAFS